MMRRNNLYLLSIAALIALGMSVCNAATVYKCKNVQGKLLYQKTPCTEEAQAVSSWTPNTKVTAPSPKEPKTPTPPVVIKQGEGGHYFLSAEVNSHAPTFVVDTGATIVSLPTAFAKSATLFCNDKGLIDTANGPAKVCTTTITELKLGNFVLSNVNALIVPNLSQPLLGMNVLNFFNIEQKDNEMKLSEHEVKAP
jgi:clan AA aspartic protease (TIGR02281 family)